MQVEYILIALDDMWRADASFLQHHVLVLLVLCVQRHLLFFIRISNYWCSVLCMFSIFFYVYAHLYLCVYMYLYC